MVFLKHGERPFGTIIIVVRFENESTINYIEGGTP